MFFFSEKKGKEKGLRGAGKGLIAGYFPDQLVFSKHQIILKPIYSHFNNYLLDTSTCTEWSITRSTGHSGLILPGSPPSLLTASRIAAKSTTAGTPLQNGNTSG